MIKTIEAGSKVMWSGSWGSDRSKEATIEYIEETTDINSKEGEEVDSVYHNGKEWNTYFICGLDNGHWAYSYQIDAI